MLAQIRKELGQTLVEVLVALAVAAIVLVALIIVVITSLKNSQFAQNQAQATKYAQQALDQIKSIRDRDQNGSVIFDYDNGGNGPASTSKFADLWGIYMSNQAYSECQDPLTSLPLICYFSLSNGLILQWESRNFTESLADGFLRQIFFEDTSGSYTTEKKITVKVKWTDQSGEHESNLQTYLTNH